RGDFFRRNVVLSFQEDAIGIRLTPTLPSPASGRAIRENRDLSLAAGFTPRTTCHLTLVPRRPGEGRVMGPTKRFAALPISPSPGRSRRGPLPLPPEGPLKGGEGLWSPTPNPRAGRRPARASRGR